MEILELAMNQREKMGKEAATKVRNAGNIPAVVYGKAVDTQSISVDYKSVEKIFSTEAGMNAIIMLKSSEKGKGQEIPVITVDIQKGVISDKILHLDFKRIDLKEEIETEIPVEMVGEPIGVKQEGGVLIMNISNIKIRCLPLDIPPQLKVDVASLKIGEGVYLKDVPLPSNITVLTALEEVIVSVVAPSKEEEVIVEVKPEGAEVPAAEVAAEAAAPAVPKEGEAPAGKEGEVPAKGKEGAASVKGKEGAAPVKPDSAKASAKASADKGKEGEAPVKPSSAKKEEKK